jgi:hypothetical protein
MWLRRTERPCAFSSAGFKKTPWTGACPNRHSTDLWKELIAQRVQPWLAKLGFLPRQFSVDMHLTVPRLQEFGAKMWSARWAFRDRFKIETLVLFSTYWR